MKRFRVDFYQFLNPFCRNFPFGGSDWELASNYKHFKFSFKKSPNFLRSYVLGYSATCETIRTFHF